ncbi:MAG: NIPSNAP family protein [Alphaproteobacteria bacterium]
MIFDHRTYTCRPGTIALHLALYEKYGKAPQEKHLGKPVLYGVTETGTINTYIHVWAYEDITDRAKRRAGMHGDPDWQAYLKKSAEAGYLVTQQNQILTAAPFFDFKR